LKLRQLHKAHATFRARGRHGGFTLVEVMVALFIMAMIALLASQAFNTASSGAAATREAMERLAAIDRTLVLIEGDLRNAIPKVLRQRFGEPLPPLYVAQSDDYWLTVMRGGMANPLYQRRTEEVRVGYRYVDETIWRDIWYNPTALEQEDARQLKLLEGVTLIQVRVLPPTASSLAAGPWLDAWPPNLANPELPLAIELTLTLEDMGEIRRVFMLLPGAGPAATNPGNNPNGGQPNQPNDGNPDNNGDGNDNGI
jgi:general secretion pathway protein J